MIRFCDKDVFCVEHNSLNRAELRSFFLQGNYAETVCVLEAGKYAGYITWPSLLENDDIDKSIQKEHIVLDEMVWKKGRQYFARHGTVFGEAVQLPVLNRAGELICFAYQDEEADRELRMLRELEEDEDLLTFCDLYSEYTGVTIYGFNEIAYYMEKYFCELGITVNVEGELWREFGSRESHMVPAHRNYEIWAEGVWQKSGDVQHEKIRSVSSEFECVNKIYEANIKEGRIGDAKGDWDWLLGKLKGEREIIIMGTDVESQDAYDLLLKNDIDICAFLGKEKTEGKRRLFGKPVLEKQEILDQFDNAVFIECRAEYSAWGFGEVDHYDYEGYRRNSRYFLLRDYTEIPENNLRHILYGKNILLIGDIDLCNRVWKWQVQCEVGTGKVKYWDILSENKVEIVNLWVPLAKEEEAEEFDIVALVAPKYDSSDRITAKAMKKYDEYIEKLNEYAIYDYTDYFSHVLKLADLLIEEEIEIRKELRPLGVVIGAIPWYSGNFLIRQSLAGHPQIIMIEDYNYLGDNLYFICMRLAGKETSDILPRFWQLYKEEAKERTLENDFPDKERFIQKMRSLLKYGDHFTSQELFVMFHVAYESMYGREIIDLGKMVIYWEPHIWKRDKLRKWSCWLGSSGINGFVLSTVRNSCTRVGSHIKNMIGRKPVWEYILQLGEDEKRKSVLYKEWKEIVIKFEDLKEKPRETLINLCKCLQIVFDESLMETTVHGKTAFYKEITGFDLKPVYNPYEEYFTAFDRMRLCLLNGSFQKKHGYPFANLLDFSRRELQEMFLKEFRWEKIPEAVAGKDEAAIGAVQENVRKRLWQMHFNEIMDIDEIF